MSQVSDFAFTKSLADADVITICCIPVHLLPDLPQREPKLLYDTMNCPHCGVRMWIGSRQKKVAQENDKAEVFCLVCLLEKYGPDFISQHNLTTMDEVKP